MKNIKGLLFILIGLFLFTSCELDNYEGPNASLSGAFVDAQTGELIESDIINGTRIGLIEHGFETPAIQYLIVKNDGTYRNDMLFSGTYSVPPIMGGNFVPQQDTLILELSGNTVHDFEVLPYIRIRDASITNDGMRVTATFRLEQTIDTLNVVRVGLYAHREPTVGEPMQNGRQQQALNRVVDPNEEFSLTLTLRPRDFPPGQQYHFRIGAVIDVPEAKYNYAPAVRLMID